MLNNDQLPCTQALLAASKLYQLEIRVYHNIKTPVIFKATKDLSFKIINLQCISYIHFNPIFAFRPVKQEINERMINTITKESDTVTQETVDEELNIACLYEVHDDEKVCSHASFNMSTITKCNGQVMCALLDTGAQVSLICESSWKKARKDDTRHFDLKAPLRGISGSNSSCLGVVELGIAFEDGQDLPPFPFAFVEDNLLPCCMLIGLNFLEYFKVKFSIRNRRFFIRNNEFTFNIYTAARARLMNLWEDDENRRVAKTFKEKKVRYQVATEDLMLMQENNHNICQLKTMTEQRVPPRHWTVPSLGQFKRHAKHLAINNGILAREVENQLLAVVSFPLMVEMVYKIHEKVAHLGRHKILDIVSKQFWHPAADEIARQICKCCTYCQLNKTNIQQEKPPTLKIVPDSPFELVAIDLLAFPRSRRGHPAALTIVDLHSKWAQAFPIKDKTSSTIAKTLKHQAIPNMVKKPISILSDNGPEFRGAETEQCLSDFNINHKYSSPYCPASNGAVERLNRTIIGLTKALTSDVQDWDLALSKAVYTYNNTYHSSLKMSPSEYLLQTAHQTEYHIPMDKETLDYWREGHPKFRPFSVGQKVVKEISRIGKLSAHKLMPRYDGPYSIVKVQANGLSYELTKDGDERTEIVKSHHKKLRPFHMLPTSIKEFIPVEESPTQSRAYVPQRFVAESVQQSRMYLDDSTDDDAADFLGFQPNPEKKTATEETKHGVPERRTEINARVADRSVGSPRKVHNESLRVEVEDPVLPLDSNFQSTPVTAGTGAPKPDFDLSHILNHVLTVQEELNAESEACIESIEEMLSQSEATLNKPVLESNPSNCQNETSPDENDAGDATFNGFPEQPDEHMARKLKEIRAIISASRASIIEGRTSSLNRLHQTSLNRRFESPLGCSPELAKITKEMADVLTPLGRRRPVADKVDLRRPNLRSTGPVEDLPWVQPSTLENRAKSKYCI